MAAEEEKRYSCHCPLAPVCSRSDGPYHEVHVEKNSLLYEQGEEADKVYYLKEGKVSLKRAISSNHALDSTTTIGDHTFLGIEAMSKSAYKESARTETPVVMCVGTRDEIEKMTPSGSAPQRVASWLVDRFEKKQTVQIPRDVLAGLLGMHPASLSRALRKLANEKLINLSHGALVVLEPEELRKKAAG